MFANANLQKNAAFLALIWSLLLFSVDTLHARPAISSVSVSGVSPSNATILWATDEPSDSQVNYGTSASYVFSTLLDSTLVTSHSVTLSNLNPSTTYHYQVASRDASGNISTMADFTFITQASQPGIPLSNGTWTMVLTQGLPVQSNDWEQLVYASVVKRSIMLSQYHQFDTEPNETLLGYDFDTNRWDIIDMGGLFHTENMPEGGESVGYFDYNPNNNTLLYHCCLSGANQPENANHTWWYDLVGQTGREEQTSPEPPFNSLQPGGAFDVAHNVFVAEGGASFVGTWTYQPASNKWTAMVPGGTPPDPSLILPGVAYDSNAQKVYLFGGKDGTVYSSNLYAYDVSSNTWTLINPADGVTPPGRYRTNFAYDSTNNIFLLYSGQNASAVFGDTWIFDPTANKWTQLNPPQSPSLNAVADFARLSYDSDHNVFVLAHKGTGGYFGGTWSSIPIQTWLFRYNGTGPNPGNAVSTAPQPAAGGINRNNTSWAKDPAIAASNTSIYVASSETGSPFDASGAAWPHIYVGTYSGGAWSNLGSSFNAVSATVAEADAPSMTVVAGTPWVSWYQSNMPAGNLTQVLAASWNGSSWQGGSIGLVGSSATQGRSQLRDVGGVPYIAFLEMNRSFYPQSVFAYVKSWNGTSWVLQGTGALNKSSGAGSTAASISIASDGTAPYVAWTEYVRGTDSQGGDTGTPPQVYVSHWNGSQWSALGGSLNVASSDWAYDVAVTYLGGQPYAAWVERTKSGNALLYVATWNGTNWTLVGSGTLNQNPVTGWAFHPALVADSATNSLYVAWTEQATLGRKSQVFVSKYNDGGWVSLGGVLNVDSVQGSAQRVSLALLNGTPVAAWSEVNFGSLRNIYVKQWNGSNWIQLTASALSDTTAPTVPSGLSAVAISANQINLSWGGATDTVGVSGYLVYRGAVQVGNVKSALTFQDTALSPFTPYSYSVAAYDASGNTSARSPTVSATTQAPTPVEIASLTLSPSSVTGGSSSTANTIALNGPAPSGGGAVVTLTSSNPSVANAPGSVTVPAGASLSPTFTVTTAVVASNTNVVISATYNGITVKSNVSVTTASVAALSSLNLSPTSVIGGGSTTANTVSLNGPAPSGGATVTLTASNSVVIPPTSVTVAAGSSVSPQFSIATTAVTTSQSVMVSATYNGVTVSGTLTVTPATPVTLYSVTLSPTSVVGGVVVKANNRVTLSAAAPGGGTVVNLTSGDPTVSVPPSVTVAAGSTAASFAITTTPVSSNLTVSISGTYNGVTKAATLTVTPPALALLALSPSSVVGGVTTTKNYVKLNGPAPSGGISIALTSGNPQIATPPASVTVSAGATSSSTFSIITTAVSASQGVPISASLNGVTKTTTLTVTPVGPSVVWLSPTTVTGGVAYTANNKVILNGPAPPGGAAVSLSSSDPSVTVPSSITVAAGATTSPTFNITTKPVASSLPVTISATYNGITAAATLTVSP